jgi:extracellular matrix protein 14
MHLRSHLPDLFTFFSVLVLVVATLPITVSGAAGGPSSHLREADRNLYHPHSNNHNDGHVFPFLRWLRDSAVEIVFGRPANKSRVGGLAKQYGGATHKRYRNEVVVRFNVTNSEEENALSEAIDRLFLDLWAFTDDYVDVRLYKQDVATLLTLLPKEMKPSILIEDIAEAVWATYPSRSNDRRRLDSEKLNSAMILASDGVDNIFFQDYQPLSVGAPDGISKYGMES